MYGLPTNPPQSTYNGSPQSNLSPLRLKPSEIELFSRMFTAIDTGHTGFASGGQVSQIFQTSGLNKSVLAEIWNIASKGKPGPLSKDAFFVACRLVSLAQNGHPPSTSSLMGYTDIPLPKFSGPSEIFYRKLPSSSVTTPTMPTSRQESHFVHSFQPSEPGWAISRAEIDNYSEYFMKADVDKDGFISGKEARDFFKQSQLSAETLRDIWNLSDLDRDSKLNRNEFIIAMHLVMRVKKNKIPLPRVLPQDVHEMVVNGLPAQSHQENVGFGVERRTSIPRTSIDVIRVVSAKEDSLAGQVAETKHAILQMTEDVEKTKEKIIQAKRTEAELVNQLELCQAQLETLKSQCSDYGKMYEEHKANVDTAASNLKQVREELEGLKSEVSEKSFKMSHGQEELDEIQQRKTEYQRENEYLLDQIREQDTAIAMLESQKRDILDQTNQFRELSENQQAILNSRKQHRSALEREKASLAESLVSVKHQLKTLTDETALVNKGIENTIKDISDMKSSSIPPTEKKIDTISPMFTERAFEEHETSEIADSEKEKDIKEISDQDSPVPEVIEPHSEAFLVVENVETEEASQVAEVVGDVENSHASAEGNPFDIEASWPEDNFDLHEDTVFADFDIEFDSPSAVSEQQPEPSRASSEAVPTVDSPRKATMDDFEFGADQDFGAFDADEFNEADWGT